MKMTVSQLCLEKFDMVTSQHGSTLGQQFGWSCPYIKSTRGD